MSTSCCPAAGVRRLLIVSCAWVSYSRQNGEGGDAACGSTVPLAALAAIRASFELLSASRVDGDVSATKGLRTAVGVLHGASRFFVALSSALSGAALAAMAPRGGDTAGDASPTSFDASEQLRNADASGAPCDMPGGHSAHPLSLSGLRSASPHAAVAACHPSLAGTATGRAVAALLRSAAALRCEAVALVLQSAGRAAVTRSTTVCVGAIDRSAVVRSRERARLLAACLEWGLSEFPSTPMLLALHSGMPALRCRKEGLLGDGVPATESARARLFLAALARRPGPPAPRAALPSLSLAVALASAVRALASTSASYTDAVAQFEHILAAPAQATGDVRSVSEEALARDASAGACHGSPLVWRCYVRLLLRALPSQRRRGVRAGRKAAREALLRAVAACPVSRGLWLDWARLGLATDGAGAVVDGMRKAGVVVRVRP